MSFGINYNTESSDYYSLGSLCSAGIADNSGSLLDSLNVMTMANSADSGSKNTVVYTPVAPTVGSIDSAGTINSAGGAGSAGSAGSAGYAGSVSSMSSVGSAGSLGKSGSANITDSVNPTNSSEIKTYLKKNYPNLIGNVLDDVTIETITNNVNAYIQSVSNAKSNDLEILVKTQVELAQMAQLKGVDKTQYIQPRIATFMSMRIENPNMSIEAMNEALGQSVVYDSIASELYAGYSLIFGTDLVNSRTDLVDLADYALVEADFNPMARLMYYETQSLGYLTLASNGKLTKQEYLDLARMDLLRTFPGFRDLAEINQKELYEKICTLTPEELSKFQKEILSLPSCEDASYPDLLTKLLKDFNNATAGRYTYLYPRNEGTSTISYEEVFKSRYDTEFNPDNAIDYKITETNAQAAIMVDLARNDLLTILDSAKTEDAMKEAIFTVLYMLTGSTDDEILTEKLQELTGMQNIQVQDGYVSYIKTSTASTSQASKVSSRDSLAPVVDSLKNGINTNSDATIAHITKDTPQEESNGFFGKIGDMFGQFSAEYVAPIADSMGISEQTLRYIEISAGVVAGVLLVAGLACGGWTVAAGGAAAAGAGGATISTGTLFAAAGITGAISAGASYTAGVKELSDLYNNGEIELYDENGNWAPDERAQAILNSMETDAALAAVDLLSGGIGSKVAGSAKVVSGTSNFLTDLGVSSAKVGKLTTYAQAGISNGINATANMIAAGALTGDGNIGANIAFAGFGALVDVKSSNLNNISDVFEKSNSNKLKQYNAMRESLVGSYLSKNEWVDGTDITKVLMGKCTVNLDYFAKNLQEGQSIVIGRDYFELNDVYMSRSHLELKKENGRLYLKDISTNGTKILEIKHPSPLDKYKTSIKAPVDYDDFLYKNSKTLFDEFEFSKDLTWLSHHSSNEEKNAWKIHIYADNYTDWAKLCEALIPYFKDNDISMKTVGPSFVDDMFSGNNIQSGKAFTIYPKNNIEMAQIAKDIDYIIRNNNLMTNSSSIMGDNQLGNTGRLFYRYEYDSKKYQNTIVDTSTPEGIAAYLNMYDANRGENNYLANDMTIDDDIWRDFDPSNPYSMPYQSTNSSNKNNMANGLAVGATVVAALGLTDANAQTVDNNNNDNWNDTNNSAGVDTNPKNWSDTNSSLGLNDSPEEWGDINNSSIGGSLDEWDDLNNSSSLGNTNDNWDDINNSNGTTPPTNPDVPDISDDSTPNVPTDEIGDENGGTNPDSLEPGSIVENGTREYPKMTINVENNDGVTIGDNGYTPEEQDEIAQTVYEELFEKYGPDYDYEINVDQWGHVTYNVYYRGNSSTDNTASTNNNDSRYDDQNDGNDWQNPFISDWSEPPQDDTTTETSIPSIEIGDLTWDWDTGDWADENRSNNN